MSADTWTHHRARVANAVLRGDREGEAAARADLKAARDALKAARTEDYIGNLLAEAPRLTADQRLRIAAVLFAPSTQDTG